jgi:DNA-binding helix-turn-helix protein
MLQNLIKQAEMKAGTQQALSKRFNVVYSRFGDYKAGRRTPDDALIFKLAEYVGLDPMEVFFAVKAETDPKNGELWNKWRAWRELNPRPLASEANTLSN